jgi:RNA polymerase sigma factor (TIGR02999 family)
VPPAAADDLPEAITMLVRASRDGDREAADRLYRATYLHLRRIARSQRARIGAGDTLSTTAVVNELYLRLENAERLSVEDRHHFFSLAARVMRQVLIDGARRRVAGRRGGSDLVVEALDDGHDVVAPQRPEEWIALDEALDALAQQDAALAQLVELHFFAGLPFEEIAAIVGSSERTVRRDWRRARAFLHERLGQLS